MKTLFLLMALTVSTALGTQTTPPAFWPNLRAGQKQTVVLYGTSLTAGGAWAKDLATWFDQKFPGQVTVINSGGPGQNSDWGVTNLEKLVLSHHPDCVFLEFSYNDAHEKFQMPVARGATNLLSMINAIQEQNSASLIVLQIMNVGWDALNGNRSASVRPNLTACADNYRRLAQEKNLPLLDHSIAWQQLKEQNPAHFQALIPDGSHPTLQGSREVTWPTVLKWLQASSQQGPAGGSRHPDDND